MTYTEIFLPPFFNSSVKKVKFPRCGNTHGHNPNVYLVSVYACFVCVWFVLDVCLLIAWLELVACLVSACYMFDAHLLCACYMLPSFFLRASCVLTVCLLHVRCLLHVCLMFTCRIFACLRCSLLFSHKLNSEHPKSLERKKWQIFLVCTL